MDDRLRRDAYAMATNTSAEEAREARAAPVAPEGRRHCPGCTGAMPVVYHDDQGENCPGLAAPVAQDSPDPITDFWEGKIAYRSATGRTTDFAAQDSPDPLREAARLALGVLDERAKYLGWLSIGEATRLLRSLRDGNPENRATWEAADRAAIEGVSRDPASEYGRLLAERDRLVDAGVDPADLDMPERPEGVSRDPEPCPTCGSVDPARVARGWNTKVEPWVRCDDAWHEGVSRDH